VVTLYTTRFNFQKFWVYSSPRIYIYIYIIFFVNFRSNVDCFPLEHFRRVRNIAKNDCYLRRICLSARPSMWKISVPTGRNFMKFYIRICCENLSRKFKFHCNLTRMTCTLHVDPCTSMVCRSSLLRMRNVLDKIYRENQTTFCVQ